MWLAFRKVAPPFFLGVFPALILAYAAWAAVSGHNVAVDFRGELYPQAKLVLHGHNPFPSPDADLSSGVNRIFPIPAALLVAPLTLLSPSAAGIVFTLVLMLAFAATLWLLEVRDWRIYGATALWPSTIAALQTGNLTILLGLLAALGWRYRGRTIAGVPIGIAIALKLYLWPLALWLVAIRKPLGAAIAAAIATLGLLMTLPFTSLHAYASVMAKLGRTFAPQSYNVQGLLMQLGATPGPARIAAYVSGAAVLALAYRRRSFPLFIAASLLLSPIVWLHYLVLLALPLALARKTFSPLWLVPLALWVTPGNGANVHAWHTLVALAVAAVVLVATERTRAPKVATDARETPKLAWPVGQQPLAGRAE